MRKYAIPQNMTLEYLLTDHLGSTSVTTDSNGEKVSEMRYKPWGEVRHASGLMPTDYTYTGQYSNVPDFGLMFYNARWYDPYLNHFIQPDSIIPNPGNVLDLNRYSYVRYNPIRYVDPSGHFTDEAIKDYLKTKYKKDWESYWKAWSADKAWMDMLHAAVAGDTLFGTWTQMGTSLHPFMFMFTGEGEDLLTGFSAVQGPQSDMNDVWRGGTGNGDSMLDIDLDWLGFVRSENNTPSFYVRPGVSMTQKQTPKWVSDTINVFFGVGTSGLAITFTAGASVPVQVFAGATGGTVSGFWGGNWYVDALDLSPYDCQVYIGPVYFNYQQTPGVAGWTMEKFQMSWPVVKRIGKQPRK